MKSCNDRRDQDGKPCAVARRLSCSAPSFSPKRATCAAIFEIPLFYFFFQKKTTSDAHRDALQHTPRFQHKSREGDFLEIHAYPELTDETHEDATILLVQLFGIVRRGAFRSAIILAGFCNHRVLCARERGVNVVEQSHPAG